MKKDEELDGADYYFVPRNVFESDITAQKFVEYGEFEKNLYGTSLEAIREVVNTGRSCILNLHPQVNHTIIAEHCTQEWVNGVLWPIDTQWII